MSTKDDRRGSDRLKAKHERIMPGRGQGQGAVKPVPEPEVEVSQAEMSRQLLKSMRELKKSNEDMIEKFEQLDMTIKSNATKVDTHIANTEQYQSDNDVKVNGLLSQAETTRDELSEARIERKQMRVDTLRLEYKLEKMQFRVRQIDEGRKRKNIIIEGVPEKADESARKVCIQLMQDIGALGPGEKVTMDSAYRIGKLNPRAKSARNILIRFREMESKIKIFQNVGQMRHVQRWKEVYVGDDLTPEQQEERKDMRALVGVAKRLGKPAKMKGNKVELDGRGYVHREISSLPKEINCEAAKLVEFEHGVAFQSHHAFLSNMYPCNIVYDEVTWSSCEQLFWFRVANYNEDYNMANRILACDDPYEAKRLSHMINITKDNNAEKSVEIMKDCIELKFEDPELLTRLCNTKGTIYECTFEKGWGCGVSISNVDQIVPANIKGNKMGKLLVELREELSKP